MYIKKEYILKKGILAFFFLFLTWSPHFSMGAAPKLPFRVDTDFSQFRHKESTNLLALYYACDESRLTYQEKEGKYEGAILLRVSISHIFEDTSIIDRTFRIPHTVDDTSTITVGNTFLGVLNLAIPIGDYFLKIDSFDDLDRSRSHKVMYELSKKQFGKETVTISDVDICSSIKKIPKDPKNVFYKNTLEVVPNPTKTFGYGLPILYYYVEAYNLLVSAQGGIYHIQISIYDSENQEVISQEKSKNRTNDSSVEVGTVNVGALSSGTYKFKFSLIDSAANLTVSSAKQVFIHNPGKVAEVEVTVTADDYMASEFGSKTERELDKDFDVLRYIADRTEISQYKRLHTVVSKREFLFDFWKRRDPSPTTPVNESKLEYNRRLQYVNINYASGFKEGWRSHRGRVYIMYGPPEELIREEYDADQKAHELWYYHNLQGGVMFVFADLSGFQDYRLIHSTHRDEIQDIYWRSQVRQEF